MKVDENVQEVGRQLKNVEDEVRGSNWRRCVLLGGRTSNVFSLNCIWCSFGSQGGKHTGMRKNQLLLQQVLQQSDKS